MNPHIRLHPSLTMSPWAQCYAVKAADLTALISRTTWTVKESKQRAKSKSPMQSPLFPWELWNLLCLWEPYCLCWRHWLRSFKCWGCWHGWWWGGSCSAVGVGWWVQTSTSHTFKPAHTVGKHERTAKTTSKPFHFRMTSARQSVSVGPDSLLKPITAAWNISMFDESVSFLEL